MGVRKRKDCTGNGKIAVSYTHLDVYKRQVCTLGKMFLCPTIAVGGKFLQQVFPTAVGKHFDFGLDHGIIAAILHGKGCYIINRFRRIFPLESRSNAFGNPYFSNRTVSFDVDTCLLYTSGPW